VSSTTALATTDPASNRHRLARDVVPSRYDLTIAPDLRARDFVGDVAIGIEVSRPTATIECNAKELEVRAAWLVGADGARNEATWTLDASAERVIFTFERTVQTGAAKLHVQFRGVLNDKLRGFYASSYTAADGTNRVIATTQLQSTDARGVFPCWDEPDFKAVFAVTLITDDGLLAVSNMHEVSASVLASGKRMIRFADTPKMSTYLVAFVVGELEATDPVDVGGVPLRVIARPGQQHLAKFALEAGEFALRYFEDWYGIAYPGTKLDLIATPDFAFGAMENLGAVTFRETLLLADPTTATKADLERIADVISHEIAHMWFGDLVTMKWWNGIWLNEAFATFAEISCCAKFRPEWDRWTSFSVYRSAAASVDGLHSTRPIEFPVESPSDAEGMFDVLTYEKGAAVLRQLEQYLGEDRFRDGVRHYLTQHSYANTETTDLFDAIGEVTGEPVRALMDGWIFQGGYPVIDVSLNPATSTMELRQRHFTYLPPPDGTPSDRSWLVPILYRSTELNGHDVPGRALLEASELHVTLPSGASSVVVNAGGHGFYRVNYSEALLAAIGQRFGTLAPVERYQIVADTWASVLQGTVRAQTFLDLVAGLSEERDVNVWTAAIGGLNALDRVFTDERRATLVELVCNVLRPIAVELGWHSTDGESPLRSQLRGLVVSSLGTLGQDTGTRAGVAERLSGVLNGETTVDPDVAPAVITIGAVTGDASVWDRYNARRTNASPQDSVRYLQALGMFPAEADLQRTLEMMLTDEVRTQDAPYAIQRMLVSRTGGAVAWAFLRDRWNDICARFPDNAIPRMVEAASTLSEPAIAAEVRAFFGPDGGHDLPNGRKKVAQMLEHLTINEALRTREMSA
jgi:puromycin-sensitive aminopeptidase